VISLITRRASRRFARIAAACSVTVAGTLAAGGLGASPAAASIPASFSAQQAAAVPGTNASYVLGELISASKATTAVLRYGAGKPSTSVVRTTDVLATIAAGSSAAVWLGGYKYADNVSSAVVLKRSGKKWSNVTLPALGANASIKSMAASAANNVWAVGQLPSTDGETEDVLHWDGKSWTALNTGTPSNEQLYAVSTSSPNNVWVIAQVGLMHWDGKAWSISQPTLTGTLTAIATSSSNRVWAAGQKTLANGRSTGYSVRFTGQKWVEVKTPTFYMSQLLTLSMRGTSVWAVGYYQKSRTSVSQTPYVLHSTGSSWRRVSVPKAGTGGQLQTVTSGSGTKATAMGRYFTGKGCDAKAHFLVISIHGSKAKRASTNDRMGATHRTRRAPAC
jgi:hypothetical protein